MIFGLGESKLKLSDNAITVLEKRYLQKDEKGKVIEKPYEMFRRVANFIASAESKSNKTDKEVECFADKFLDIMVSLEFLPNSPTFTGAGTSLGQLSACFVLPVEDSMEGIFGSIKNTALIHKSGGGTGFSFSRLRPKNSLVQSTKGTASGPVSFMQVFNAATEAIKQGGTRRGANMGILRCDHPDILEFITCKKDNSQLNNFNISVALTDIFFNALEADAEYDLINPSNNEVVQKLKAKDVFDKIVDGAWQNGDPGVIFIDEINRHNPTPQLGQIESTNPCVVGETLISTGNGFERIRDIYAEFKKSKPLKILVDKRAVNGSGLEFNKITKVFKLGKQPVMTLTTKSGFALTGSYDHKIFTKEKGWVELQNLKAGQTVLIQGGAGKFSADFKLPFAPAKKSFPKAWSKELGQALGLLVGDGWLRSGDKNCRVGFTFSENDFPILKKIKPILNQWYGAEINEIRRDNNVYHLSYHGQSFVEFFSKLGVSAAKAGSKVVPETIFTAPKPAVIGFLQGLFTADGTVAIHEVNHTNYIRLTSKSKQLLQQVQLLLLNLGIISRIYNRCRKPRTGMFTYINKQGFTKSYSTDGICYELQISKDQITKFIKIIGFLGNTHQLKINKLKKYHLRNTIFEDKVKSVVKAGSQILYDLTEPKTNLFITNGIVTFECGEQPLLPYESCNLGSINLAKFIKELPGKIGKTIDYERLKEVIGTAVRFLDNVIDLNRYPLEEIKINTQGNRKIGLGVMGFSDMLLQLNVPYDSQEALDLGERVMRFVKDNADFASRSLAAEKGVFPNFPGSLYDKTGQPQIRNATRTTIAPTGTLSIMADCSSGIEPLYAVSFVKNILDGSKLVEVNKYFEKVAKEKDFYSKELMQQIADSGSIQKIPEIPENVKKVFVTAHDISPEWHVRMQAVFQKYVDNAVSKTINFPNSATRQDIAKAYLLAFKLKCKGITVYRDGSREVQVLTTGRNKEKKETAAVVPQTLIKRSRPPVMRGMTYKVKTSYGDLYVVINDDENGNPFEVFATIGKAGGFFAAKSEAICRLISLSLRSGIPATDVIEQIKGIRGPMPSWSENGMILSLPDAIAQILERHISKQQPKLELDFKNEKKETPPLTTVKSYRQSIADLGQAPECPECGNILEIGEGCLKCRVCGFSRCE